MNNKYLRLKKLQSFFLMLFFMSMSLTAFAQSGSGSNSGSQSNSGDCCDQGDKPGNITFRYVGGSCSNSANSQGSKFECSGGSTNNGSVYIVASEKENGGGKRFFSGNVSLNQTFNIDDNGDKFGSKTFLEIFNSQGGSRLQRLNVHTSCSAPIVPGDQFGALILESIRFQNGVSCSPPTPPEVCPTPSINNPTSGIISSNGNFCINAPVVFSAPDLGFPCLTYTWNFGNNASPSTFIGRGPVNVTFFSTGNRQISLTIDNNCDRSLNGGGSGSSGSDNSGLGSDVGGNETGNSNDGSDSGSTSNGSSGTDSSEGGVTMNGAIICPGLPAGMGGEGSGSSGSDNSGSGGGSDIGGNASDSNDGTDSGSTSGNSIGTDSSKDGSDNRSNCVPCRKTTTITITVENCNQNNNGMIGDMVWNDLDGDGIMDNGEPGIQGVIATLSKDNGQFIDQTTTDFFGKYKFNNVMPNMSYKVTFTNIPAGFSFAPMDQGGNEETDSDVNPNTGMTTPVFIGPGGIRLDQDAGLVQGNPNQASVGDRVFADNNGNGIQDPGEPGIGGVTVKLQNSDGNTLQTLTTNGNGNYTFSGLQQGLYKVMFNTPNGFVITMPKQGAMIIQIQMFRITK